MKKLFAFLSTLLTINMSAQIVEFSDELLSQYNNQKQEKILTRPIDLDLLFPPVDLGRAMITANNKGTPIFSYVDDDEGNIPNYIGYHIFIPQCDNHYVLTFSSNYDTVTLSVMPKGVYEVIGILVTKEECEELRELTLNSAIKTNGNTIKTNITHRDLQEYCRNDLNYVAGSAEINRRLFNGERLYTMYSMLVLRGDDGYLYYLNFVKRNELWRNDDFRDAFLVEQYDYIKEKVVSQNDWTASANDAFLLTTPEGLEFEFLDTIGIQFKEIAVKDGNFIAIMNVGPDSILHHGKIAWKTNKYYASKRFGGDLLSSDTISYLSLEVDGFDRYKVRIVSRSDYDRMMKADRELQNRIIACQNKKDADYEAAHKAEQEKQRKQKEFEQRELERQRQAEIQYLISRFGERLGLLIFEHKVTLGMTQDMCREAWGRPRNRFVRRVGASIQEIWYYGVSQYLLFENGMLVECASNR